MENSEKQTMQLQKIRNLSSVFILITFFLIATDQVFSNPMFVNGRYLYTADSERVVLRGVNEMLIYSSDRTGSWVFNEIGRTGANAVRIIAADNNGNNLSSEELASAIRNANNAGMILIAGPWMATCDWDSLQACVNWWLKSDIKQAVQNNEDYFLLNIANEAGSSVSNSQYLAGYTSAITQLRNAGYKCPLVIDAASCGQGGEQALNAYDSLLSHDPLSNIIVSWHTYNAGTSDEIKALYDNNIARAVNDSICFIIGEGPTPASWMCVASPYGYGMQKCQENEIGWLGWSWGLVSNGDCNTSYDWTTDGYYGNWETNAGRLMAVDHEYSIANTSSRPLSLKYLSVSPGKLLFDFEAGSHDFYVSSSLNWNISVNQNWIDVNPAAGSNSDTISVTVSENTGFTLRSGTITVTAGDIVYQIAVRQTAGNQGQVQAIPIGDFDSGSLDPFYTWGAPLSIEANPDGTPGDSVALLDQTGGAWNGITSWWDNGDLFKDADSISVDVYANIAGAIQFHCDNSVSGGSNFDELIEGVPAKSWTRHTLIVSDMPVSDYKQFAIQYDKADSIYFDNFTLYKSAAPEDPYLIFDPATYPQDSLHSGMEIVTIDSTPYLQVVIDQWNQSVDLIDSVLVPLGVNEITFKIRYASGSSGVDINNAWYKYLFKNTDVELFNAEGNANTIADITAVTTNCNDNITPSNGLYINSILIAGQEKSGWTALTGDTIWIGKTTFVGPTVPSVGKDMDIPGTYTLEQNYPNPFNPTTHIKINIATASHVKLTVFTILGKKIATLENRSLASGSYIYKFDGTKLASGIYIYRIEAGKFIQQKKMLLIK